MRMSYGAIVLSQDNLAGEHCGDEPFVQNRGGWGVLSVLSMRVWYARESLLRVCT